MADKEFINFLSETEETAKGCPFRYP